MSIHHSLNYLEFPTPNFEAVKAFYGTVFNWSFTPYGDDYLAFKDAHLDGGFFKSEKVSRTSSGAALAVFYSENLEQSYQAVLDNGGTISVDIFSFPGGRRFQFLDPVGNELAVWSDR